MRPVVIEQRRFLGTVFLWSEFKLTEYRISSGVVGNIFAVIFICGNLFLQSTDNHEILSIKFSSDWNSENDKRTEGKK